MNRYSVIHKKIPRELVLLQGSGCRWGKCLFCDYHADKSDNPYIINKQVLSKVTGVYGVLDIINSGSAIELDENTISLIKSIIHKCGIHTIWFEMHYMYRHHLNEFALHFAPAKVKFRCGIETFDADMRDSWCKGISKDVSVENVAEYFQGVCLLCCTKGDKKERIITDITLAKRYFEYVSINLFCDNSTRVKRDNNLVKWFMDVVYPLLENDNKIEVLFNNTDLGVG